MTPDGSSRCSLCSSSTSLRDPGCKHERREPVQADFARGHQRPAGTITRTEHLAIWEVYARRYGRNQSADRIAERGGFGYHEIVVITGRPPQTWRALIDSARETEES